jgi:hypothetical protein
MQTDYRLLRDCLASASPLRGLTLQDFIRDRKLNDFGVDEVVDPSSTRGLAARALHELCIHDGRAMDQAVWVAVVDFLDVRLDVSAPDDERRRQLEDLKKYATDWNSYDQCLRWVRSWYP